MTYDEIKNDVAYLSEDMANLKKEIPSNKKILKISFAIPALGFLMSLISVGIVYVNSQSFRVNGFAGLLSFIGGDAIFILISSLLIGCVMALMSYNYVLAYNLFSDEAKAKSILLHKIKRLSCKLFIVFSVLSLSAVIATFLNPIFSLAVPVIMFVFIIASSMIINMEITRVGIAPLFSKLITMTKDVNLSK